METLQVAIVFCFSLITVAPILPNNIMDDSFLVRQIKVAILEKVDQYSTLEIILKHNLKHPKIAESLVSFIYSRLI